MLSFFPTPYPDELLYSILARYHERSTNISITATSRDLFGAKNVTSTFDLPGFIENLISNLPIHSSYSAESIINRYTLFPLYAPFFPPERALLIVNSMRKQSHAVIHARAGIMAGVIPAPTMFRFCPDCLREDVQNYGEPYWHRLHQITGVIICPIHYTFLQNSTVRTKGASVCEFSAADTENCPIKPIQVKYSNSTFDKLVLLAQDVGALLNLSIEPKSVEWYHKKYQYLLIEKGLATVRGIVNQKKIIQEFIDFYGAEFLELVYSRVDADNKNNWLSCIVRKHTKVFNPIRHLLLIRFLQQSVESFFDTDLTISSNQKPFGDGPWVCFNGASNHYLEKKNKSVSISYSTFCKTFVGTFSCECGFVYSTSNVCVSQGDKRKLRYIKSFGILWEQKLTKLLIEQKYSFQRTAKQLKVSSITVKFHAVRLGLISISDHTTDIKIIDRIRKDEKVVLPEDSLIVKRENKREIWLKTKELNPLLNKSQLRQKAPGAFVWLVRHDRKWLDDNSPAKKKVTQVNKRVDWTKRDSEILVIAQETTSKFLNADPPVRITVSLIERHTGLRPLLSKHLHKLPNTGSFLLKCTETVEEFQIRRVHWAAHKLLQSGKPVKAYMIMEKANIKSQSSENVINAINRYVTFEVSDIYKKTGS